MPPEDDKNDVLSSLPRTRPQRRSARRDSARKPASAPKAAAAAKPAAAKPKARKAAGAAAKPAAAKKRTSTPRPRVEAVKPAIPPAGFAPPKDSQERGAPSGTELVGTAIQAAGELVQIGAAIGGQALKSALGRLGRG